MDEKDVVLLDGSDNSEEMPPKMQSFSIDSK